MIYNKELKNYIKKNHIYYWQIANKMGIAESTLYRRMRLELSEYEKSKINNAINEILKEEKNDTDN